MSLSDFDDEALAVGDRASGSSLTPMLLDLDEDTPTRDELASQFFAKPIEQAKRAQLPLPVDDAVHEAARFDSPAFKERQRYLMRYVASAVAVSGAICIAAFFRIAAAAGPQDPAPHAAHAEVLSAPALSPEPAPAPPPPPALVPPPAAIAAPTEAPATSSSSPAVADVLGATHTAPAVASVSPVASASEEKAAARRALERGNWNAAIAAAQRSVQLDATDAEAWLILGGAYQERGSEGRAKRAFASCAASAKAGRARAECASLAH